MNDLDDKPKSVAQWLAYIEDLHPSAIEMGLERVQAVAGYLDLDSLPVIISIAGTNGKGSTCAMLESIYHTAGYKVGAYVSPHLIRYNERVRVNCQEISDEDLCSAFSAVESVRGDVVLTYFEMGTLAAIWHFARSNLDVILLEVGMGGRLDAVNVFEPACSIVTCIDLDHLEYLGDTREKIAIEKAGIFRPEKVSICGDDNPPVTLIDYAKKINTKLKLINQDFFVERTQNGWCYLTEHTRFNMPALALKGDFQLNNAACAICTVESLQHQLPVGLEEIYYALENVTLLGRFYTLSTSPEIIVDVAHNPQAARSLAQNLSQNPCNGKTIGVFAMLADKDIEHVISELSPYIATWYLADTNNPRGAKAKDLAVYLEQQAKLGQIHLFDNIASALQAACLEIDKNDRIIVFGSFYTVADVIKALTVQGI